MSSIKTEYIVIGYDLTEDRELLYTEEWTDNEEHIETWENNQVKGEIQLFSDPCCGNHLIFGYIVSVRGEGDSELERVVLAELERQKKYIDCKLWETGLNLSKKAYQYGIIIFTEYH